MFKQSTADIFGIVQSKRELKKRDGGGIFGYLLAVSAIGQTFEVRVSAAEFAAAEVGITVHAVCKFELYMGKVNFIASAVLLIDSKGKEIPLTASSVSSAAAAA